MQGSQRAGFTQPRLQLLRLFSSQRIYMTGGRPPRRLKKHKIFRNSNPFLIEFPTPRGESPREAHILISHRVAEAMRSPTPRDRPSGRPSVRRRSSGAGFGATATADGCPRASARLPLQWLIRGRGRPEGGRATRLNRSAAAAAAAVAAGFQLFSRQLVARGQRGEIARSLAGSQLRSHRNGRVNKRTTNQRCLCCAKELTIRQCHNKTYSGQKESRSKWKSLSQLYVSQLG